MTLSLVNSLEKPSGVELVADRSTASVWGKKRWEVQSLPRRDIAPVLRFLEERVPEDATIALALGENDFGYPAFGRSADAARRARPGRLPRTRARVSLARRESRARPRDRRRVLGARPGDVFRLGRVPGADRMLAVSAFGGLAVLVAGLGALAATGGLLACCLRLRSPIAFLLATYLIAWTWLVAMTLALSPAKLVTRGWLVGVLALGLAGAFVVWRVRGSPAPPSYARALGQARDALAHPAVLVLAIAVAAGTAYVVALAFFTPANDYDALAYHLARASFWRQEHGLGYIEGGDDWRLNLNPPNAEIGQLGTMVLSGSDRYAALPQLLAYAALAVAVGGLARRIGLGTREAMFAALAFATLPVVALQASGALNDLVVASFLAAAAYFALGAGLVPLALVALAVGLAVGTKFTALIGLVPLVLVAAVGQPLRRWPALAGAGLAGLALGSTWYLVNAAETGRLDGNAPEISGQQAELDARMLTTAMRLAVSYVDMSGAPWPRSLVYLVAAGALAAAGLAVARRSRARGLALLAAAAGTACVVAAPLVWELVVRPPYRAGLLLGGRDLVLEFGWGLNTDAEPTLAWYGPLFSILLVLATGVVLVSWWKGKLSRTAVALAAAPWVLVFALALSVVWDPWRGRFLLFGVALAAATWSVLLRWNAVALAAAAIGSTALFLSLATYNGKPSGLFSEPTIWGNARWEAQTRLSGATEVLRFVEENVPEDARVGISFVGDNHVQPYFGPDLSRHVAFVPAEGGAPTADTEWLVLDAGTRVRRCPGAWQRDFTHGGWNVERRLGPDTCLDG